MGSSCVDCFWFYFCFQRKQREIKKTKTAPVSQNASHLLAIAESPSLELSPSDARLDYFKSLTTSQTLDRRAKHKIHQGPISPKTASPQMVRPPINRSNPEIREPVARAKQKKPRAFSKIAILSSFFEQKIAALANSSSQSKGRSWKFPGLKRKPDRYCTKWNALFSQNAPPSQSFSVRGLESLYCHFWTCYWCLLLADFCWHRL